MPKRSSKKDLNQLAASIVEAATSPIPSKESVAKTSKQKNPAAVALGKLGGLKGGRARAEKLTAKKRSEIAKKAAISRWKKSNS